MEIICRYCQGTIDVKYTMIFKLSDDYFVTHCLGCDTENEVWDVYDWFDIDEIQWIEQWQNESSPEGGCISDDED